MVCGDDPCPMVEWWQGKRRSSGARRSRLCLRRMDYYTFSAGLLQDYYTMPASRLQYFVSTFQ